MKVIQNLELYESEHRIIVWINYNRTAMSKIEDFVDDKNTNFFKRTKVYHHHWNLRTMNGRYQEE